MVCAKQVGALARPVLKKTLAAGVDELILLEDERFGNLDGNRTALDIAEILKEAYEDDEGR